jgi:hypothetical protein
LRQIRGHFDDALFAMNRGDDATTPGGMLGLFDNTRTNKNTAHSYAKTYRSLFYDKTRTVTNVMEMGIRAGGSIRP